MIDKSIIWLALLLLKLLKSENARHFVLTEAVKHLFNTVSAEDLLKFNIDGTIQFEDKVLPASYKKDLQEQAKLLPSLFLWKVLKKDIQYQLRKKMFEQTSVSQDLLWGKLITFYDDIIRTRIETLGK